tara:strand:+ start:12707 stop:13699 length:993 start_codon:yes stop_codon:yes gene_type:complete
MYNVAHYIENCLISLLTQGIDEREYEVIVVNDGSTDASLEVAEQVSKRHSNIFVYSQENKGAVFTRNRMMKLAKGEYIYFVDADDYLAHNSLASVLNFAISNQIDVMGFDMLETNSQNDFQLSNPQENELPSIISGSQFLKDNRNMRIEIWWYLIRKDFLDSCNISFDRTDYDGDVVFTLRLFLEAKKVAFSPLKIYRYFQSPESTMRSNSFKAKKRIIDYFIALIDDFSNLIEEVKEKEIPFKNAIIDNFKFRRDVFTFFTIGKMVKGNLSVKEVNQNLIQLETVNAYPMTHFNKEEFSSFRYKTLSRLFNQKLVLFFMLKTYNLFKKK